METERGIVLGVCLALAVAGAVAAYFWFQGPDTHTVEPGAFTETDDGVLIGAEADAIEEPLDVEVGHVDPAGEPEFEYYEGQVLDHGPAWEIYTEEVPQDQDWLGAPQGSTFVVALPVPEGLDRGNLTGMRYEYGEHVMHAGHPEEPLNDTWTYATGYYHPDEDVFLMTLASLGSPSFPSRVTVVEHAYKQTRTVDGPIEAPWSEQDPGEVEASEGTEMSTLSFSPPQPREELRFLGPDTVGGQIPAPASGGDGFQLLCHMDDCSTDRGIRGYTIEERAEAIEDALQGAVPVYESMEGSEGPHLEKNEYDIEGSDLELEPYEFNLHGPHETPLPFKGSHSNERCEAGDANGWYNPVDKTVNLCLNTATVQTVDDDFLGSLEASEAFAAHELFHAYQRAYQPSQVDDAFVTEATARLVQGWEHPTERSRWEYPPPMERGPLREEVAHAAGYTIEYFYDHLFSRNDLEFRQLGGLFEAGLTVEDTETFVEGLDSPDTLGDAYWDFTKDLLYEDQPPSIRPSDADAGTCELYEMDITRPPDSHGSVEPSVPPETLTVEDYTGTVDADALDIDLEGPDAAGETIKPGELEALASDVFELEFDLTGVRSHGFWVRATLESTGGGEDPEMRMKLYDAEDEGTEECWEDGGEAELGGTAGLEVWTGDEEGTLVVSNLEHDRSSEYRVVFDAFPLWAVPGGNGQRTYYIETPQGTRELTTMSGHTQPQGDEEPGSLVWSVDANGGITRPSYAFGNIYTVYGQGGLPASLGMTDAPEGRIVAHDAETGETAWRATADGAELDIGTGPGRVGPPTSGFQHEALAGNGQVYVPGTHHGEFYPPQNPPCPGTARVKGLAEGVLAFDADDGSLAWGGTPVDLPHEKNTVHQIALGDDEVYAKGTHTKFVKKDKLSGEPSSAPDSCEDDRRYYWDTVSTHKLWSVPSDGGGEFEEVWSTPYNMSEMVVADGQAFVAGWGWPSEAPPAITAVDLDTGEVAWSHQDVFNPPPPIGDNEDGETFTAAITQLAYDQGSVFVGTTVRTPNGLQGAVYAYDEAGRQWRYETDEMTPEPAVYEGTVYTMTGANVSDESDPENPSDVGVGKSVLHAVNISRNETRWAVNASSSMTVTDDRIYVGKRAPISDPMGSSVAALNRTTGQVVWVNEEDVQGPGAATGAFVDGILYVNTQAQMIALRG